MGKLLTEYKNLAAFAGHKAASIGGWFITTFQSGKPYVPSGMVGAGDNFLQSVFGIKRTDYDRPFTAKELITRYRGWVYVCANKNAINAAQVPLRLFSKKPTAGAKSRFKTAKVNRDDLTYLKSKNTTRKFIVQAEEVEEVLDHPVLDLLNTVNEFQNGFELVESLFLSLELTGNAYWFVLKGSLAEPVEIWPLLPQYMTPVVSESKFISHWIFSVDGTKKIMLESDQVIHFKYPDPRNPVLGMGKLEAILLAADLSTNMNRYEVALFRNNAIPDTALIMPADAGPPSPEEQTKLKAEWRKQFGGVDKAGGMCLLWGGADIKKLAMTPKEMGFLKSRTVALEEIAGGFGVPMSKLITKDVNRANAEQGDYQYMSDTILPMLTRVEQKINEKLMPMFDGALFVSFDNPVPEDREFRLKESESHLKTGYSSVNIERKIDNKEPVPWGEVPIMTAGMVPFGSQPLVVPGDDNNLPDKSKAALPLDSATNSINPVFIIALQGYFNRMEKEIVDQIDPKAIKDLKVAGAVGAWFDMEKWNRQLQDLTLPFIRATFFSGGKRQIAKLVKDRPFNELDPAIYDALQNRSGKMVHINATTIKLIRNTIADGIEAGEGTTDIRKRITSLFNNNFSKVRAERISRTETIWAHNAGTQAAYEQSGVVRAKRWITAFDDRLCEFCRPMDGKIIDVQGDYFQQGSNIPGDMGGSLTANYDTISHPPLHPNCRCTTVPILL